MRTQTPGLQRVLVTGCASGIGKATMELLLAQGAEVIGIDRKPPEAKPRFDNEAPLRYICGDCCDKAVIEAALETIPAGCLNGIVPCAAESPIHGDPVQIVRTNYLAAVQLVTRSIEHLSEWSAVVFVASTAAYRRKWTDEWLRLAAEPFGGPYDEQLWERVKNLSSSDAYALSKWALIEAAGRMSRALAHRRIRVNCVVPGLTRTEMSEYLWRESRPELQRFLEEIPFRSFNLPEEVARVIVFLLQADTRMVTGSLVHVDGGWYAYWSHGGQHEGSRTSPVG